MENPASRVFGFRSWRQLGQRCRTNPIRTNGSNDATTPVCYSPLCLLINGRALRVINLEGERFGKPKMELRCWDRTAEFIRLTYLNNNDEDDGRISICPFGLAEYLLGPVRVTEKATLKYKPKMFRGGDSIPTWMNKGLLLCLHVHGINGTKMDLPVSIKG